MLPAAALPGQGRIRAQPAVLARSADLAFEGARPLPPSPASAQADAATPLRGRPPSTRAPAEPGQPKLRGNKFS